MRKWQVRRLLHPCRIERDGRRWSLTTWVFHGQQLKLAIGRPPLREITRRIEVRGRGRTLRSATEALMQNLRLAFPVD